jgi:DNA polymerase-1
MQTSVAEILYRAGRRGVRIDLDRLDAMQCELDVEVDEAKREAWAADLYRMGGTKKAPKLVADMKKIRAYVKEAGGSKLTPKGKLATDADYLRGLKSPKLDLYIAAKDAEKRLSLVEALRPKHGRILRPRWNPFVSTGRLSCSEPNLTQVPRVGGYRELFVPRDGYVYLIADYSTLELRTLADVCVRLFGHSKMADALWAHYNGGKDVHQTTADALGIPRQVAKAINFGLPGGMGWKKMIDWVRLATDGEVILEEAKARQYRADWFQLYPEVRELHQWVDRHEVAPGVYEIELPWSKRVRRSFFTESCNYLFQGTGADVMKKALLMMESRVPGALVAAVHDELWYEVPVHAADGMAQVLGTEMTQAGQLVCPYVPWPYPVVERLWKSKGG